MHSESEVVYFPGVKMGKKLAKWAGLVPRDNAPDLKKRGGVRWAWQGGKQTRRRLIARQDRTTGQRGSCEQRPS